MSRTPRLEIAGGVYHVTNRGVERRNIVSDDTDRRTWWNLLDEVASRCQWRIYAYALLDNHFHLFLQTPHPNLSRGMQDLDGGYATLFNQRHERTGHLFQGRFHSLLVEREGHAWELSRYIHLNPVRAGIVAEPAMHVWSSYRHYLDPRSAPAWLDFRTVLYEVNPNEAAARIAYKRFVDAGLTSPPPNPLDRAVDGRLLGSAAFVEHWQRMLDVACVDGPSGRKASPSLDSIFDVVSRAFQLDPVTLASRGRHNNRAREAAVLLAREFSSEPLEALAARFGGVTRSAVTEIARRARLREERDRCFAEMLRQLREELR